MTEPTEPENILERMARDAADDHSCKHVYNVGSYHNPPEYCENDAEEGSDYCSIHQEDEE